MHKRVSHLVCISISGFLNSLPVCSIHLCCTNLISAAEYLYCFYERSKIEQIVCEIWNVFTYPSLIVPAAAEANFYKLCCEAGDTPMIGMYSEPATENLRDLTWVDLETHLSFLLGVAMVYCSKPKGRFQGHPLHWKLSLSHWIQLFVFWVKIICLLKQFSLSWKFGWMVEYYFPIFHQFYICPQCFQ